MAADPGIKPTALKEIRQHLAQAYRRLEDSARLADCYRVMIAADPGDNVARHLLAAAEGTQTQAYAKDFAQYFFDNLAADFDQHLVGRLGYSAPANLAAGLQSLRPDRASFPAALDLGCGTGLMGAALVKGYDVRRLVGIDLSEKMVREAEKRGIYHQLIAADVAAAMQTLDGAFDLVIAADVFIYLGALGPVLAAAHRALGGGGLLAFTVESGAESEVELAPNGHYRHNLDALLQRAASIGFTLARADVHPIRKEVHDVVMGHYVYLEKI